MANFIPRQLSLELLPANTAMSHPTWSEQSKGRHSIGEQHICRVEKERDYNNTFHGRITACTVPGRCSKHWEDYFAPPPYCELRIFKVISPYFQGQFLRCQFGNFCPHQQISSFSAHFLLPAWAGQLV